MCSTSVYVNYNLSNWFILGNLRTFFNCMGFTPSHVTEDTNSQRCGRRSLVFCGTARHFSGVTK